MSKWKVFESLSWAVLLLTLVTLSPVIAQEPSFTRGDIFAAIGDGKVNWYRADGTFVMTLDTGLDGATAGMAFDSDGNLYVTNFAAGTVSRFDSTGKLLGTFGGGYGDAPESLVFDKLGNLYVGHAGPEFELFDTSDRTIKKFDPDGKFLEQFDTETDDRGTDWIELAPDQCTMYYTSEGTRILRFDVCSKKQLPDFASGLYGPAYALRLLGDGSVLVADDVEIRRLDADGNLIKKYDVPGEDYWFALNRDPDGTSFWSGNVRSGTFYKFDIESGDVLLGPIEACHTPSCLGGLTVFGELIEASSPEVAVPTRIELSHWWIILAIVGSLVGLTGLVWWLRNRHRPTRKVSRPSLKPRPVISAPSKPQPPSRPTGANVTHGKSSRPKRR